MTPSQIKKIKVGTLLKCYDEMDLDDMLEGKDHSRYFDLCVVTGIRKLTEESMDSSEKYYEVQWINSRFGGSGILSKDHFTRDDLYELV